MTNLNELYDSLYCDNSSILEKMNIDELENLHDEISDNLDEIDDQGSNKSETVKLCKLLKSVFCAIQDREHQ